MSAEACESLDTLSHYYFYIAARWNAQYGLAQMTETDRKSILDQRTLQYQHQLNPNIICDFLFYAQTLCWDHNQRIPELQAQASPILISYTSLKPEFAIPTRRQKFEFKM